MPEQKQPEEQSVDLLTKLIDKATLAGGEGVAKGGSSAPVYLIIVGIVVLGFAVMGFMLVRARRKAALLASKLRKQEEKHTQEKEQVELSTNESERKLALTRVELSRRKITKLRGDLAVMDQSRSDHVAKIKGLTNWDDLVIVDKRGEP